MAAAGSVPPNPVTGWSVAARPWELGWLIARAELEELTPGPSVAAERPYLPSRPVPGLAAMSDLSPSRALEPVPEGQAADLHRSVKLRADLLRASPAGHSPLGCSDGPAATPLGLSKPDHWQEGPGVPRPRAWQHECLAVTGLGLLRPPSQRDFLWVLLPEQGWVGRLRLWVPPAEFTVQAQRMRAHTGLLSSV